MTVAGYSGVPKARPNREAHSIGGGSCLRVKKALLFKMVTPKRIYHARKCFTLHGKVYIMRE